MGKVGESDFQEVWQTLWKMCLIPDTKHNIELETTSAIASKKSSKSGESKCSIIVIHKQKL